MYATIERLQPRGSTNDRLVLQAIKCLVEEEQEDHVKNKQAVERESTHDPEQGVAYGTVHRKCHDPQINSIWLSESIKR